MEEHNYIRGSKEQQGKSNLEERMKLAMVMVTVLLDGMDVLGIRVVRFVCS